MSNTVLNYQLDQLAHQLQTVFADLSGNGWHAKSYDGALSPHETAIHLADCYSAFLAFLDNRSYEWGSFRPDEDSPEAAIQSMWNKRAEARAAITVGDERAARMATDFIILHDAYHVGQMVSNRRVIDPSFDYSKLYAH